MTLFTRPHGIKELYTDAQKEVLERIAGNKGLSVEELVRRLFDEALDKAFYTDRATSKRVKTKAPKVPVAAVKGLRAVYARLRVMEGDEFEQLYGEQLALLEDLIARRDVDALTKFEAERPWLNSRKGVRSGKAHNSAREGAVEEGVSGEGETQEPRDG